MVIKGSKGYRRIVPFDLAKYSVIEHRVPPPVAGWLWPSDDDDLNGDDDIYIMMSVCGCVTKNHHFLLGISCDHLNYP